MFGFSGQDRALVKAEVVSGPPYERGVSGRFGRGDEEKPLCLYGQLAHLTQKSGFDLGSDRQRIGQGHDARQFID